MSLLPSIIAPEQGVDVATSPIITSPFQEKILRFAPYCSPNQYLPPPLEGFAYASIGDRLYIFGGSDLNGVETADLYVFTLKSGWQKVENQEGQNDADKPTARVAAAMTAFGQKLHLFGGINEKDGWLNDLYEFDAESIKWKRMRGNDEQNGPSPRDKIALIASRDKIYLYGGFGPRKGATSPENNGAAAETVQIQGDAKESSTTNGSAHGTADTNQATENGNASGDARDQAHGSEADEERALKVAMNAAQNQQVGAEFGYFDDFYCVDPSTGQWSLVELESASSPSAKGDDAKKAIPPGLAAYTASAMADKLMYFGGKASNGERTNNVYCFALGLKKWLPLPIRDDSRWPAGRSFHSSAAISDRSLVVFGGRDGDDWERDDLWLLDTNKMQWMLARCEGVGGVSAPCARYGQAMAVLPDADSRQHLVIYGGSAELDPASGVAQDVLTDMYVVPVDEIEQACAPVFGDTAAEKEAKHQHHLLHHRKSSPTEEGESSNDEPPAAKVPKCDDCIDL